MPRKKGRLSPEEIAESPIDRAVALIEPPDGRQDNCRLQISDQVWQIQNTVPRRSITDSKQFAAAADSLRKAHKAVKKLSYYYQDRLLHKLPLERTPRPRGPEHIKPYFENLFNELSEAAVWLDEQSMLHKVPHSDRRRDYQKLYAAWSADWLLYAFSKKKISLTPDSDFLVLASTIYEAATGNADVDLRWQCRTVVADQKQK
jgi:hypothetical protein